MPTDKDVKLIQYLIESSRQKKIRWEVTATGEFVTSLRGRYKIILSQIPSPHLIMRDPDEHQMLSVDSDEYWPVSTLIDIARRDALDVDSAIDDILAGGGE